MPELIHHISIEMHGFRLILIFRLHNVLSDHFLSSFSSTSDPQRFLLQLLLLLLLLLIILPLLQGGSLLFSWDEWKRGDIDFRCKNSWLLHGSLRSFLPDSLFAPSCSSSQVSFPFLLLPLLFLLLLLALRFLLLCAGLYIDATLSDSSFHSESAARGTPATLLALHGLCLHHLFKLLLINSLL